MALRGSHNRPTLIAGADSGSVDAFSRLRVANTGQRVDTVFTYDKQPLLFDETTSGTGAAAHNSNLRAVYLTTGGTASGAKAELRLRYYTPYTPGNSQLVAITGTLDPDGADFTNCKAEIGYGDSANAVGFRYNSTGAHIFLRSSISGTAADLTTVAQASWDNPVPDVDWTKSQIFLVDFQSLAVGRIRFYMDRGGLLVQVHEITNDNLRTGPYWQLASLPVFWSIENTGTAAETCRALAICSTVKSEGGADLEDLPGFNFAKSSGSVEVSTTLIPILSLEVQPTFNSLPNRMLVWPLAAEIYSSDQPVEVRLIVNGTLTDDSFAQVDANSGVYADTSATAISGGRTIGIFYVTASNRGGVRSADLAGRVPLSVAGSAGNVGDIFTIAAVRAAGVNANIKAAIDWREVR
jgi:hypothetical protein